MQRWKCLNKLEMGSKTNNNKKKKKKRGEQRIWEACGTVAEVFIAAAGRHTGSARVLTAVNAQAACIGNTHTHTHTRTHTLLL